MGIEELRIGNYVRCVGGNVIKIDRDDMMCILTNTFEVRPIQLAEDLFLKCGFEKKRGLLEYDIFEVGSIGDDFVKRQYTLRIDKQLIVKVKYIHHLQNIIHSLTGKELEIKK